MAKKIQTVCGVAKECEVCKAALWNDDKTKVIGCRFGHIKPGRDFKDKRKDKAKQNILVEKKEEPVQTEESNLAWGNYILAAIVMALLFMVANIFITNWILSIIILVNFLILLFSTYNYWQISKNKKGEL